MCSFQSNTWQKNREINVKSSHLELLFQYVTMEFRLSVAYGATHFWLALNEVVEHLVEFEATAFQLKRGTSYHTFTKTAFQHKERYQLPHNRRKAAKLPKERY